MPGGELVAFVGVSAIVIVTPGQDTALTIRNTLLGGAGSGVATAFGVCVGQALWTIAASAGLTAILVASEPAFMAVKLLGALYLVVLGARTLYGALRPGSHDATAAEGHARTAVRPLAGLRQGAISNLGNPKMAMFFTSLLPQFAPHQASFLALLLLGLAFASMTLAWLTWYAVLVARIGGVLRRPAVRRALDGVAGAVLVGLGLRLATEHR